MIAAYLSIEQVVALHTDQLRLYGGAGGLRDRAALEAAVAQPAMTFDGDDLYEDLPAKAAALMHSLVLGHPFVDGNKRVAVHAALLFLALNGVDCAASAENVVAITLAAAEGSVTRESLAIWFRHRQKPAD